MCSKNLIKIFYTDNRNIIQIKNKPLWLNIY